MNRDGDMKRKRGRPVGKDGGMRNQYRLRMSDDMASELDSLCELSGKSRATILREAFYDYVKNNKSKGVITRENIYEDSGDDFYEDYGNYYDEYDDLE